MKVVVKLVVMVVVVVAVVVVVEVLRKRGTITTPINLTTTTNIMAVAKNEKLQKNFCHTFIRMGNVIRSKKNTSKTVFDQSILLG